MNTNQTHKPTPKPKRVIGSKVSLAELVQRHLLRNRTKAASLARKAGINKSILSKVISGTQTFLMPEVVEKLAKAMGIHWSAIYAAIRKSKSDNVDKSAIETCIDRSKSLGHKIYKRTI